MKIVLIFSGLLVALGAGLAFVLSQLGYFEAAGPGINFIVQKGENFSVLSRKLERAGVVRHERALRWYVTWMGTGPGLKRGEFALYQNMPVPELVHVLTQGKPIEHKVTVPEGFNLYQIADLLSAQGLVDRNGFLEATRSSDLIAALPTLTAAEFRPVTLEGYLYPDTYLVQKVETPKEIVQSMVHRFREVYRELGQEIQSSPVVAEFHFSPHQVVVLASIVEKETGNALERPIVASVFLNRLRKRMRLQTDPTIIYGLWLERGRWNGNISRKDLNGSSPYNTYQINGLPPGPISNPSASAIRAVLNPAQTDYLYFVSRNDGTHTFSKEYKEHSKAVRELQVKPGARAGKSWRDLPSEKRAR
jgi:UPF0755 protein